MELERSSGILLHITSLPSQYGIGDFGEDAFKFINFLVETKQKFWQILPLSTTNSPSPYSSESSFGGNPWLISPSKLIESNVLSFDDLNSIDQSKLNDEFVNFKDVKLFKDNLLKKSFENFKKNFPNYKNILNEFFQNEIYWIEDFILFMTIKDKYEGISWCDWPETLRCRHQSALDSIRENEKHRLEYHLFVQYIFDKQWKELKKYANDNNIKIIGDMPMYVDYHSIDLWANSHLFKLDSNTMKLTVVSGFPADENYDIQIWNQPVYKWDDQKVKDDLFQWWIKRFKKLLSMFDIIRIDHFRGFISHYVIPLDKNTQKPITSNAHWIDTPGYEFFSTLTKSIGSNLPLIVEDIGSVTSEVFKLRDHFKFYGIRILQMGFYSYPDNIYSPHNYITNSIAYTGTHDNATSIEWWSKIATRQEKDLFIEYIRRPFLSKTELIDGLELEQHVDKYISWYFIQMVLQSSSNGAILLMQDILNVQIRMNYPGKESSMETSESQNWSWRFKWSQLTSHIINQLNKLTEMYGRNLIYGKSIPPKDMIMKDDSSFFHK